MKDELPQVLLKSGRPFKEWSDAFAAAMVANLNRKTTAEAAAAAEREEAPGE